MSHYSSQHYVQTQTWPGSIYAYIKTAATPELVARSLCKFVFDLTIYLLQDICAATKIILYKSQQRMLNSRYLHPHKML